MNLTQEAGTTHFRFESATILPAVYAKSINFIPSSLRSATVDPNRYMSFTSLFGTSTSDFDRAYSQELLLKVPPGRARAIQAKSSKRCFGRECLKPRVVYSQYSLTAAEGNCIEKIKESACYVCGANFLPEEDTFYAKLYVRKNLECNSSTETAYYSSNLPLPPICYYCGIFTISTREWRGFFL